MESIGAGKIKFGALMGTKMGCPDMKTPRDFNTVLVQTRQYAIKSLFGAYFFENFQE